MPLFLFFIIDFLHLVTPSSNFARLSMILTFIWSGVSPDLVSRTLVTFLAGGNNLNNRNVAVPLVNYD